MTLQLKNIESDILVELKLGAGCAIQLDPVRSTKRTQMKKG